MGNLESKSPFFTIIIPCYNQGNFLIDCINSLLGQSFSAWEAIVINDGSTDNTIEIASEFSKIDNRIHIINQKNIGLSGARNAGIKQSKGDYLLFLDADDWIESEALLSIKLKISTNLEYELYAYGYSYWDRPNGNCYHTHKPNKEGSIIPEILESNLGPCHSIVVQNSFAKIVGDFDPILKSCEDWDFWIRAGKLGAKILSDPKVLAAYRYVPNSMSRNAKQMYESLLMVSTRAISIDDRIQLDLPLNKTYNLNIFYLSKCHFVKCLGVSLMHIQLEESINWYSVEMKKFNWTFEKEDWIGLSSNLSFKYFLTSDLITFVLFKVKPVVYDFLISIGYSETDSNEILLLIFSPQLKKRNHLKFGKVVGGVLNRFGIWL